MIEKYKCEACGKYYDKEDEHPEVAEGGNRICPECWAIEEPY